VNQVGVSVGVQASARRPERNKTSLFSHSLFGKVPAFVNEK
jgi:hypothetical protein